MQPPEGLELVGLLAQGAPVQESWLMRLAFRCIPRRKDNQDAGYRLYCRAFDRRRRTGTQLARHFLTRGVHVIQEHPSTRMTSVPYKRWRRNRAAALGKHVLSAYARGTHMASRCEQLRRCLAKTPPVVHATTSRSCSTPLWICCCWLWALMPPPGVRRGWQL